MRRLRKALALTYVQVVSTREIQSVSLAHNAAHLYLILEPPCVGATQKRRVQWSPVIAGAQMGRGAAANAVL
jgi:hypothetical protein